MIQKLAARIRTAAQPSQHTDAPLTTELAAAVLLMEVAYADSELGEREQQSIRAALQSRFQLDTATIDTLLQESASVHADSVGVQAFTRALTDCWEESARFELVVALWQVALAEDGIDALEEHRIRGIADLLYVSHSRFIEAKLIAKRDAPESPH
ncbi:MAG: TerB family tellurite resistance protein [Pseudomonadales bacterium]